MRNSTNAPKVVTWTISLVLFVVALIAHFAVAAVPQPLASWSWIIGFGLLLLACRLKDL